MALRKRPRADLRRVAPLLQQLSLAFALLVLIAAFRLDLSTAPVVVESPPPKEWIEMDDIRQTTQHREPPPKPAAIVEVKDDVKLPPEDLPFDTPELPIDVTLPDPPKPPAEKVIPQEDEQPIFIVVEEQPELIGGLAALQRAITYPEAAKRAEIEGRVTVQFVVDEEGRVRDAFVLRGIGGGCDEEALRAVEGARFTPGKQRGKAVKVQMTLPVTFRLR